MPHPIASIAAIHDAVAARVEHQVRMDAAALDPTKIEEVVQVVLKYGPSVYQALSLVFQLVPKA